VSALPRRMSGILTAVAKAIKASAEVAILAADVGELEIIVGRTINEGFDATAKRITFFVSTSESYNLGYVAERSAPVRIVATVYGDEVKPEDGLSIHRSGLIASDIGDAVDEALRGIECLGDNLEACEVIVDSESWPHCAVIIEAVFTWPVGLARE